MQRVLVVDDERDFRDQICLCLESAGCQVESAANCREAVRVAEEYRPDVLVADWMLRDHLHGLHVSEVLGAVNPGMHTVLMTGYASEDLRAEAKGHHVAAFLEKPFEPERLTDAVRATSEAEGPAAHHPPVGVLRAAPDGSIRWANQHARALIGDDASSLGAIFGEEDAAKLRPAPTDWITLGTQTETPRALHLLGKCLGDAGQVLVLLDDERLPVLRDHPVVQTLLGVTDRETPTWTVPGHLLLVDDEDYVRRFVAGEFQRAGAACLTAENGEVALRLFERNDEIRTVLLDWYLPGDDARELVAQFRTLRPDVDIVGLSGEDRREDFARIGIDRYLAKPVRIEALIEELSKGGPPAVPAAVQKSTQWRERLEDLCHEFNTFMQRRPGARATRAMSVVKVLCDAWPRAMSVQEIVDTLWTDPSKRMRRAAGSVRNALNTLARNFEDFNKAVAQPLYGMQCGIWRSEEQDSKLCRYALVIEERGKSVRASADVRAYLASLPRPVLDSLYAATKGEGGELTPEANQVCQELGTDIEDEAFRDAVIQAVEGRA